MKIHKPITWHKFPRGYKYQLTETCCVHIGIPGKVRHDYFTLYNGYLWIKKGYAWDGATLFPDLESIIAPSLLHDCLYQMIKLGLIDYKYKKNADISLKKMSMDYGMPRIIAWLVFCGVRCFGWTCINKNKYLFFKGE